MTPSKQYVKKFRKKPVVIEAIQFTSAYDKNLSEILEFGERKVTLEGNGDSDGYLIIETLEGEMRANPKDWIIKGVKGEIYPCKPDIFEETYEEQADE